MSSTEGFDEFLDALGIINRGGYEVEREFNLWLEALAFQFLEEVQREIIRTKTVHTRNLFNSFKKGDRENVCELSDRGLTMEIGTNVEYAEWVNTGHNQKARWVPGVWHGRGQDAWFEYIPGADTGMMLKAKWVEGSHYFDTAEMIFERIFQRSIDRKFGQWLERMLGGEST